MTLRLVDYSYGLAIGDVLFSVKSQTDFNLTLAMINAAEAAIKYKFIKCVVKMQGASVAPGFELKPDHEFIVCRGQSSLFPLPPMKRSQLVAGTPQITGTIELEAVYGHPDADPVRRVMWELDVRLVIAPPQPQISMTPKVYKEVDIERG